MDSIWGQQSLEGALIFLVFFKAVSDRFLPDSLSLFFCPPEWGQESRMEKRDHTVVIDQEKRGLQELFVSLGDTSTTNNYERICIVIFSVLNSTDSVN